jgi:cobalt-zinc-cadmium efflux system membrane fusion protein
MKYACFSLLVLVALAGCTSESEEGIPSGFALSETMLREMKTHTVAETEVETELSLTGRITFNEDRVSRVFPLTGGFVQELRVELGDYVTKGSILAIVRSPDIAGFTREEVTAAGQKAAAEKRYAVSEQLFASGLISELELLDAKRDMDAAIGEFRRIQDVVDMYGVSKGAFYPIKSPVSGYIIKKDIALNMEIRTEDISPAFVVGSLDEVWVLADVYESDIARVPVGSLVEITTLAYPDSVFRGRIDKVFNLLDPASKTMKARIVLDNKSLLLKPEMFATIRVVLPQGRQMLSIPADAVIFDKDVHFVMVLGPNDAVETRTIEIDSENSKTVYVRSGLKAGDRVIVKNQLLMYDALND